MRITRIFIQNFTNYQAQDCSPDTKINILQGENAQGKSNFLDAIHYLSRATSYRHSKDKELIRWNNEFFRLKALIEGKEGNKKIEINYLSGKKGIFIDDMRIDTIDNFLGSFLTVIFSPEDLTLIKGSPDNRRRFLDDELLQSSHRYAKELYRYKKILLQRNNLLKKMRNGEINEELLSVYDRQMAQNGIYVLESRKDMLEKLKPLARLSHRKLTDGKEELEIIYLSSFDPSNSNAGLTEESYIQLLKNHWKEDTLRGYTGLGPHRDDFKILINGKDAKIYGSQGQQRTVALSLKMAEIEFLKAVHGEYPVLLLDDVLSELDNSRRNCLIELVSQNIQTFITCTDVEDLKGIHPEAHRMMLVEDGKIV
ncbi:DNA replication/repair protein RecF [Clostridia bacterium]|nr:DNA replication/repair protein RecF [Clostridia bacterium]